MILITSRVRSTVHRGTLGVTAAVLSLLAAGCGGSDAGADDGGVQVVATTSILGDLVSGLTDCAGGSTEVLMPAGVDPHEFAASSAQVAELTKADLVISNGLGLEEGLLDTLESLESDGLEAFEVGPQLDPLPFGEDEHAQEDENGEDHAEEDEGEHTDEHAEEGKEHDHHHGSEDPHVWHDPTRMAQAVELIGSELADRTGDDAFAACGTEDHDRLVALDAEVEDILSVVLDDRRVLVTDHDAFGYFASAFDFEIAGAVIPSPSTLAEPSSAELADLVELVRSENVPAIFSNNAANPALVESVAAEAGADIEVVELFVDSLGPEGSGAETYEDMMTTNATRIAKALTTADGGSS